MDLFGPTKGDRIRLADTDLVVEIERDLLTYGDEAGLWWGKECARRHGTSKWSPQ